MAVSSCGGGEPDRAAGTRAETSATAAAPSDRSEIDGRFDVGGHELYMTCKGSGKPTVVYLHGSVDRADMVPHGNATPIQDALSADHRVCLYDRRNVGASDEVDRPQRPADAMADLDNLLTAARVEPPYVLLGASFGGLLSYLYANANPDEVVGMVLLDSMFPDELALDPLLPPEDRFRASDEKDESDTIERISHYKVIKAAQRHVGEEPDIPVTYLSSIPEGFDRTGFGTPEYKRQVLRLQRAYVRRFSPGRYVRVDAPHFMEPVIPGRIAKEVRAVIRRAER